MSSTNAFTSFSHNFSFKIVRTLLNVFNRMYHFPSLFKLSCFYYSSYISKASSMCTFFQLLTKLSKCMFSNAIFVLMQIFQFRLSTFLLFEQTFTKFDILFPICKFFLYLRLTYWLRILISSTHSSKYLFCVVSIVRSDHFPNFFKRWIMINVLFTVNASMLKVVQMKSRSNYIS